MTEKKLSKRQPLLCLISWSLYYKYDHFWKTESKKKKKEGNYFRLIVDVSIKHGNATGAKLSQHSAGLHSAGPWSLCPVFKQSL